MINEFNYEVKDIISWNRTYKKKAKIIYPRNVNELKKIFLKLKKYNKHYILKTGQCSYDNKSITDNFETFVISLKKLNKIISLNKKKGFVEVEAGALIPTIVKQLKSKNCSLYSVPGGSHISIGGAISANVIGKDSSKIFACFGDTLESIHILNNDGIVRKLNKSSKKFYEYIGAFGLSGIILSAKFKIKKINSPNLRVKSKVLDNLEDVKHELDKKTDYKYIFLDPFFRKGNFGIVFEASTTNTKDHLYKTVNLNSYFFEELFFKFSSFFVNFLSLRIIYKLFFFFGKNKNSLVDIYNFHYPSKYIHLVPLLCRDSLVDYEILIKKDFNKIMSSIINFLKNNNMYPLYMVSKKIYKSKNFFFYQFSDNGYSVVLAFDKNNAKKEKFVLLEKIFSKFKLKLNICKSNNHLFKKYNQKNTFFMSLFKKKILDSKLKLRKNSN